MSNETPEIEGQQTIDEATASATELLQEGDGPTPEADALDDRDAKKDESGEPEGDEPATSDPTVESAKPDSADTAADASMSESTDTSTAGDSPDEHYFRVHAETHNAGADQPHSTETWAPMKFDQYLRAVINIGKTLGEDVEGILRSL
jgi:hypothetical protein